MEYTIKNPDGSAKTVISDKPLTHCFIDVPDGTPEFLQYFQLAADKWLVDPNMPTHTTGSLHSFIELLHVRKVIKPDDYEGLKVMFGDHSAGIPGGVMYANDPEGISHANHCECKRCRPEVGKEDECHVVMN